VLRTGDNCIGIAAVMPLAIFRDLPSFQQMAKHWHKHADASCKAKLQEALQGDRAAVLLTERVHNAPSDIAAAVLAILFRELGSCAACGDPEVTSHADFDCLLVCAKGYEDSGGDLTHGGAVRVSSAAVDGAGVRSPVARCPLHLLMLMAIVVLAIVHKRSSIHASRL
jgi:hypothetical protein